MRRSAILTALVVLVAAAVVVVARAAAPVGPYAAAAAGTPRPTVAPAGTPGQPAARAGATGERDLLVAPITVDTASAAIDRPSPSPTDDPTTPPTPRQTPQGVAAPLATLPAPSRTPAPAPVAAAPPPPPVTTCPATWFCYPRLGVAGPIVPYTDCSGGTDVGTQIRSYDCLSDHYLMGHAYTTFGLVRQWQVGDVVWAWGQRYTVYGAITDQSCGSPSFPLAPLSMQTSLTSSACGPVLVVRAR